jgi:phage tail sheath protein FI
MTRLPAGLRRAGPALAAVALLLSAGSAAATPIALVDTRTAAFVGQAAQGPLDQPVVVDSYTQFTAAFGASTAGLANPYLAPSVAAYFVNGGVHLVVVRVAGADDASLVGVDGGLPGTRTGLQALREASDVGAIAVPGAATPAVQAAMIALCEGMGDRLAILDPVSPTDVNAVTAQRAALSTADGFAALYFPWVQAAPAGVSLLLPPSGFVAGVLARTSPPVSPTGSVLSATGVSLALNSTQLSDLNLQGIDTIRLIAAQGVLVWGARTLASNIDWQYLAVRRAGLAIASSLQLGTAWCLTQPNDATLWTQLRIDVTDFMQTLFLAGWFQGTTPAQAYFAHCDATTMTAQDVANGRTIVLVGFAPIAPAQFILLRIVQQRSPAAVPADRAMLALRAPRPNPSRARTTIAFELPDAMPVTLRIHDAGGRLVRTLAAGEVLGPGPHERAWDGRDERGGTAAGGVYFVRLQAAGRELVRRVTLLH